MVTNIHNPSTGEVGGKRIQSPRSSSTTLFYSRLTSATERPYLKLEREGGEEGKQKVKKKGKERKVKERGNEEESEGKGKGEGKEGKVRREKKEQENGRKQKHSKKNKEDKTE